MLRSWLVYASLFGFCVAVDAGVAWLVVRFGWPAVFSLAVGLLAVFEVVFAWPGEDGRDRDGLPV